MKGFILFFIASLLLIGGFIFYFVKNPKDGMIVRQDGKWIIVEHNNTTQKR